MSTIMWSSSGKISGEWLQPELVYEARKEEMAELKKHSVYTKVSLEECFDKTGAPPVGTLWVDINKGDKVHPEYRTRLVACDEGLFAATPPLEVAVTEGVGHKRGRRDKG